MADESTRDILRNARKRRDAKKEEPRGGKTWEYRPAEDKAAGKRPIEDKAAGKRPAEATPPALAAKRLGKLIIQEPSELGSKAKAAEKAKKAPAKEAAKEVRKDPPSSAQQSKPRFKNFVPLLNPDLIDCSVFENQELTCLIVRDSILPRDFKELNNLPIEENLATMVQLSYQVMVRSYLAGREYQSKTRDRERMDTLITSGLATTDKEIKSRVAVEEKLKFVEEQTTQAVADLQLKTSELDGLKEKCAQLVKESELRQAELKGQCSKVSELQRSLQEGSLQEECARTGELQASLKARSKEEEQMKVEAVKAYRRSAEYKEEAGQMLLEAYDKAFEYCKKKVAQLFPDLEILS